ncbi:MAG: hypothetical protein PHE77_00390 [Candidatus Pacebacteria bacterium]|nr:hypothetical protein [Candidatus Paceibacterota bacterium]
MPKKTLITFIILFLSLLPAQFSFANIFSKDTLPIENPSNVPDPLMQYTVEPEAKNFFQKAVGEWQKFNNWATGFWTKYCEPYFGSYLNRVEQNIKQGWEEEKQEYRQDFFKALGLAWERLKNFVLHKQGS